jgi:serine/threonine-protein kinase
MPPAGPGRISHFRLLELLGRGGMGEVYRAHDQRLDRHVALKLIRRRRGRQRMTTKTDADRPAPREDAGKEQERRHKALLHKRFVSEAQVTCQLDHPHIVPIYELGEDRSLELVFFSMKLVEGDTLSDALRHAGAKRLLPYRLSDFLQIFIKVCDAVAFAHSRSVVHRDLKPANVMVGEFGQVYLMDWGVALLLEEYLGSGRQSGASRDRSFGKVVGTIRYMSPEQVQARHKKVDERSDIFSLGATLYHILTGRAPYTAKTLPDLLREAITCDFNPPIEAAAPAIVPERLNDIVMKAMAKDPAERYPTAFELQRDVESFLRGSWQQPTETFAPGERIVVQGEQGHEAYIILNGRCTAIDETDGGRVVLREMGPGELFGETAVFSATVRTATVEAVDEVTVTRVNARTLTSGLGLNSWLGDFVKVLAERFSDVDGRLRQHERDRRK